MKSVRALVLGLLLSGYIVEALGQEVSSVRNDAQELSRELRQPHSRDNETTKLFRLMGKNTIWTPVNTIAVNWQTFHTQGLIKIGETFYVSAVEVLESTV